MKESKLIWMQKEVKQMQMVLMALIQRLEILEGMHVINNKQDEEETEK